MLNEKMIMTGSNGRLKELDTEDAQNRPRGIVLRMTGTWKV